MWRRKFRVTPEIFFNDYVRYVSQRPHREQRRRIDRKKIGRKKIKAAPSGEGRRGDGRSVARWTYPERLRREAHFVQCNVIVCI
jgi:hypothetical protein